MKCLDLKKKNSKLIVFFMKSLVETPSFCYWYIKKYDIVNLKEVIMKKNIIFLLLLISLFSFSARISDKVIVHKSAASLSDEESAIIAVPAWLTLIEIDNQRFKVNGKRVKLSPGKHHIKFRENGCIALLCERMNFNEVVVEANKMYLLNSYVTETYSNGNYRVKYEFIDITEEDIKKINKSKVNQYKKETD